MGTIDTDEILKLVETEDLIADLSDRGDLCDYTESLTQLLINLDPDNVFNTISDNIEDFLENLSSEELDNLIDDCANIIKYRYCHEI